MNTFKEVKKKDHLEYNKWVDHLKNTKERTNYSIRRMDLLIISISGAGIYIIFETIRELKTGGVSLESPRLLLWSGIAFLLAITANFISQLTGYYANNHEECYALLKLRKIEGKKYKKTDMGYHNDKVDFYNTATDILNISSIVLMFIGLVLLAVFNYHLF